MNMLPDETKTVASSSFWVPFIAVWLVLVAVAVTLTLCLAIWNLIEAF